MCSPSARISIEYVPSSSARNWLTTGAKSAPASQPSALCGFGSPVIFPTSIAGEKTGEVLTVAVTDFLADLRLSGSERVMGALALALAEGMDASPAYAKGKLARELREVLAEFAKAELSPANLSLLEGVEL
jgi:hypothetical protein